MTSTTCTLRNPRVSAGGLCLSVYGSSRGHHLLDLSEGGMLVEGLGLPVGARFTFTLDGLEGHTCAGDGRVVHRSGTDAGVEVERWGGRTDVIRDLVARQLAADAMWSDMYGADWM